ncbi:hypothetical protein K474DRAFT_1660392 [Panus rudis PR-1116 ss-1]|nr:hypothetical protein K474DRAFT_1660392 [Panus rudis PR-1116 ss-1]
MKPTSLLVLLAVGATTAQASWFGSGSSSANPSPTQWTADQLSRAQSVFQNLKESAFDTWDESRLREFLLEQGVIEPKGTREQLALLAKQKYKQYNSAASSYSASVSSLASKASNSASTAVYGDSTYQASKSASSYISQATADISRKLDDSKDYVYSTWDDNRLRKYLEDKGVIKTKQQATRDELLAKMRETYAQTTNPVWKAWSDSYTRDWLVQHGILKSNEQKTRDQLATYMNKYYYDPKDTVYSSWTDSQSRQWLIDHGIIKSDAQLQREKLQQLVADNYVNAKDTVWSGWKDSDMRDWLIRHGYLKSDAQKTRDELVDLMHSKYNDYSARTAPYLVWPDARLRAYLRENGLSEDALPTSRPGLIQEVRIRWVQTQHVADDLFHKILNTINSGVETAEDKLGQIYRQILEMITGYSESAKTRSYETYDASKDYANEKVAQGRDYANQKYEDAKATAATGTAKAGQKGAEYESAGKKYWNEKVEQAKRKADEAKVEL